MKTALSLAILSAIMVASVAFADTPKPVKSFHVKSPKYSQPSAVKHIEKRKQKAIQWYHEKTGK